MKKPILFIFLTIILLLPAMLVSATYGTRFWTSLPYHQEGAKIYVVLVSEKACDVKVENPNTGWEVTVQMNAHSYVTIPVPKDEIYTDQYNTALDKALLINSSEEINVFMYILMENWCDAINVYPENSLLDEYIIQNYPVEYSGVENSFLIGAAENNTEIDIVPADDIAGKTSAFTPFTITLHEGETYKVMTSKKDLSGTYIKAKANKKIAVYAGNHLLKIADSHGSFNVGMEQVTPLSEWGKEFILLRTYNQGANRVRITASTNNTHIFINNDPVTIINAHDTYEFEITYPEKSCNIRTSESCMVQQYMVSERYNRKIIGILNCGDPSISQVSPLNKTIQKANFAVLPPDLIGEKAHQISQNYITILVKTEEKTYMELDGVNIADNFRPVEKNSSYSYAHIEVEEGYHTLRNEKGFIAQQYGLGKEISYHFNLGSSGNKCEKEQIFIVKEQNEQTIHPPFNLCLNQTYLFHIEDTTGITDIKWQINGIQLHTGDSLVFQFNTVNEFDVKMITETNLTDCPDNPYQHTVIRKVNVDQYTHKIIEQTICEGEEYDFYGKMADKTGVYTTILPSMVNCDTLVTLNLVVMPYLDVKDYEMIVNGITGDSIIICRDIIGVELSNIDNLEKFAFIHEFDERNWGSWGEWIYEEDTIIKGYTLYPDRWDKCKIRYVLETSLVCNLEEFILEKTVYIADSIHIDLTDTLCHGDFYDFYGEIIQKPGMYKKTIIPDEGCDTIATLNLTILSVQTTLRDTISLNMPYQKNGFDISPYESAGEHQHTIILTNHNGCDSIIKLYLTVKETSFEITLEALDEICGDDTEFELKYHIVSGKPAYYALYFDDKALERGFSNIEYSPLNETSEILVPIPEHIIPDNYTMTVYFYETSSSYISFPVEFTINYPASILEQKWKDVIAVLNERYNGGYTFSQFQWYVNDNPINGQTGSNLYIHEGLQLGAEYRALLTRASDNVTLLTCPFIPMDLNFELNVIQEPDISSYKNVLTITVEQDYDAVIWNEMGLKMGDLKLKAGKNEFTLNYPPGMYILEILDFNAKSFYRRFIVR